MASPAPLGTAPEAYLAKLEDETRYVRIPGLAGREDPNFPIDEVYIPLASAPARSEALAGNAPNRVPLEHCLSRRHVLLTGAPSSGKTTFLRRVAFELCRTLRDGNGTSTSPFLPANDARFPVLISLPEFGAFLEEAPGDIDPHSPEWIPRYLATQGLQEIWRGLLAGRKCLLLLDDLDRIGGAGVQQRVARLLEKAASEVDHCDFLITARARPSPPSLREFPALRILSVDAASSGAFSMRWNTSIKPALALLPEFGVLGVNPFLLTGLTAVLHNNPGCASHRTRLYHDLLHWFAKARHEDPYGILKRLRRLALHLQDPPTGKRLGQINYQAVAELFPELHREIQCGGILAATGEEVRFTNPGFQDYLAAEELASLSEPAVQERVVESGKACDREWRETMRFFTAILHERSEPLLDGFIGKVLGHSVQGDLLEAIACASFLKALQPHFSRLGYRMKTGLGDLRQRLLAAFHPSAESIDVATRAAAGIALGQIGDPRLDEDNWIVISTSTFLRGAQKADPEAPNYDPQAFEQEAPVHLVALDTFRIQRFPVTVEQFAKFIEQGGYRNPDYWPTDWAKPFSEPEGWHRQQIYPNLPVAGVSWYEAAAYCAWAGCRLPTEAEWERTAGGPHRTRYPWGDEPAMDATFANYNGGFPQPTPVGLYPKGNTADGVSDMLGNVFEWCQDWYGPYKSEYAPNPLGPARGESKVVRGGSWTFFPRSGRVSHRDRFSTSERHNFIGFRCAG